MREFFYNGTRVPDPAPNLTVEQVRELLTPSYPEIATASLAGPEDTGGTFATPSAVHRVEGVSRARLNNVERRTGGVLLKKAARTPSGSQSHSGRASPMQRVLRSRTSRRRGNPALCGSGELRLPTRRSCFHLWGSDTRSSLCQALPSLADVSLEYSHEVNAELVYELCAALVREGLGTAETWKKSGGNALTFAQHAMMSGIGAGRGDLIQRNVEYHLEVSDQLGRAGSDAELEDGQLVGNHRVWWIRLFKIGPALDALEAEAEGWVRRSIGR